jgi:hypothetical protein
MGQQVDSISCNSAAYATELLNKYNPQDSDDFPEMTPTKCFRWVPLTYAAATRFVIVSAIKTSFVTSADLDHLYKKMKQYIAGSADTSGAILKNWRQDSPNQ